MIRAATEADIPVIAHMLRMLHEESPHYVEVPVDAEFVTENLRRMVNEPSLVFLFWEGRGFIVGQIGQQWYDPRPRLVEHLVYCLPVWRGMGGFFRLIKAFEDEGKARGAAKVCVGVTTGIEHETLIGAYRRLGYAEYGTVLEKKIGD